MIGNRWNYSLIIPIKIKEVFEVYYTLVKSGMKPTILKFENLVLIQNLLVFWDVNVAD